MPILQTNQALAQILAEYGKEIADFEHLSGQELSAGLETGRMVILANPAHKDVRPTLIGQPGRVKVNANLGTSLLINNAEMEIRKLKLAEKSGAHTVMDLSTAGDLTEIRRQILAESGLPLGTVPLYVVAQRHIAKGADPSDFTEDELFEEIAFQAGQGVDFMTLHCGVTLRSVELALSAKRGMGIVSRGGSIMARWMRRHKKENPLLTQYDRLLEILRPYNVTISLGDGLRPGGGCDAGDGAQWEEVIVLGELARRALASGVQSMIEGPGHVPLHLVQAQIQGIKRLTGGAPLYVLGPLTTDCAPGYDHISGAIGGTLAAYHGADYLCYLTPAEHLTLPGPEDVWNGVQASLIAAQSAEAALGRPWAVAREDAMCKARAGLNWEGMAEAALDPHAVRKRRQDHKHEEECAMCGKLCAIKMLTDIPGCPEGKHK